MIGDECLHRYKGGGAAEFREFCSSTCFYGLLLPKDPVLREKHRTNRGEEVGRRPIRISSSSPLFARMRCVSDPDALDVPCIPLPLVEPYLVRYTGDSLELAKKN
jgi:hypothetical protein